jgi:hypothetical protein
MLERDRWVVHESVAGTIDSLLRGIQPILQVRTMDEAGQVKITEEQSTPALPSHIPTPEPPSGKRQGALTVPGVKGLRGSGKMTPVPTEAITTPTRSFEQLLDASFTPRLSTVPENGAVFAGLGPNGEDLPLHIYPYAIARHQIEQVIRSLNLPVVVTKDIDSADVVLALRSHIRNQSKVRHMAKARQVPIHVLKSGSAPQIARALRRLLHMEDPNTPEIPELDIFSNSGSTDELEALEEARLAVEQIVIPKGQPVELLPRSATVRKMQHELVEHYRLKSNSFGEEPNRRLRIYPA